METIAILPIKRFDAAKQRLSGELTGPPRRALAEAMFSDVLIALGRSTGVDGVLVVTCDHAAQRIAEGNGALVLADRDEGHNPAARQGVREAIVRGARRALLVPGDCPLVDPRELDELISRPAPDRGVLVVPDRHGTGTNALLLTPPDVIPPAFGPGSCRRHLRLAGEAGAAGEVVEVESLALDLDTPPDLAAVRTALASRHGGAAHTRGMLGQLMRSRIS